MRAVRRPVCPPSLVVDTSENYRSAIPSSYVHCIYRRTRIAVQKKNAETAPLVRFAMRLDAAGGNKLWTGPITATEVSRGEEKATARLGGPAQALLARCLGRSNIPYVAVEARRHRAGPCLMGRGDATTHDGLGWQISPTIWLTDRNVNCHLGTLATKGACTNTGAMCIHMYVGPPVPAKPFYRPFARAQDRKLPGLPTLASIHRKRGSR